MEEYSVSLIDPLAQTLISIPARGRFCKHLQCFSLSSFVENMEQITARRWLCPICSTKIFDIQVDKFLEEILNEVRENGNPAKEVLFKSTG